MESLNVHNDVIVCNYLKCNLIGRLIVIQFIISFAQRLKWKTKKKKKTKKPCISVRLALSPHNDRVAKVIGVI